jgi:hypothetical protein
VYRKTYGEFPEIWEWTIIEELRSQRDLKATKIIRKAVVVISCFKQKGEKGY